MSIFPKDINDAFDNKITEQTLDNLESLLMMECKSIGVPYTRMYLRTILYSVQRYIKLGLLEGAEQGFTGGQISYVLHVERLLARFEKKIADQMPKNESLL